MAIEYSHMPRAKVLVTVNDLYAPLTLERKLRTLEAVGIRITGNFTLGLTHTRNNSKFVHDFSYSEYEHAMRTEASGEFLSKYAPDDLAWVNARLDRSAMAAFGFEIVTSPPGDGIKRDSLMAG